jgi:NAD(P)-dependent dehydrogenase (short-subunit alcohol dehydrogenase family)
LTSNQDWPKCRPCHLPWASASTAAATSSPAPNTGIGKVTALELARAGAQVDLACRSAAKTAPVVDEIKRVTGNDAVRFYPIDLTDLGSVRACADALLAEPTPIHTLINNAGMAGLRGQTAAGFELAFAANHLGHYLLTRLLLPRLTRGRARPGSSTCRAGRTTRPRASTGPRCASRARATPA